MGQHDPGHPEYGHTPGVETTTGPLGQGISTAVGMAIAGKHLEARFGAEAGFRVFVIASDGDLMEGVSNEASSLAGHLGLDNLVVLYDDNHVTIDGDTSLAFTEDRADRYEALGWRVSSVSDGNDLLRIDQALTDAIHHQGQPCLISVKTIIGFGSRDAGTSQGALGRPRRRAAGRDQAALGFDPEKFFVIPEQALARYREAVDRGKRLAAEWEAALDANPNAAELRRIAAGTLPPGLEYPLVRRPTTARWRPAPRRAR